MVKEFIKRKIAALLELDSRFNDIKSEMLTNRHKIDVLQKANEELQQIIETQKAEISELKSAKVDEDNKAEAQQLLNEFFCGAKGDYR